MRSAQLGEIEMIHVVGEGFFGWGGRERRSDRYGFVSLWKSIELKDGDHFATCGLEIDLSLESIRGKQGKLRAVVLETRESHHIGDIFHGFSPSTPEVGDVIELGVGRVTIDHMDCENKTGRIGIRPDDEREVFWLNPHNLYRAHDQTVRLEFVEGDLEMEPWVEEK